MDMPRSRDLEVIQGAGELMLPLEPGLELPALAALPREAGGDEQE